jgi:hypothetical protein
MLQNPATPRFQLVTTLSRIRQEWQDAADGNSLLEVEGNMGMLLADLINGISLSTSEQIQILGGRSLSGDAGFFALPRTQLATRIGRTGRPVFISEDHRRRNSS